MLLLLRLFLKRHPASSHRQKHCRKHPLLQLQQKPRKLLQKQPLPGRLMSKTR